MQLNCWDANECGRGPDGDRADELGVCPAALDDALDGMNGGQNAGRACWLVAGTFCGGRVQGTWAEKRLSCMSCTFFKRVRSEQAAGFRLLPATWAAAG